MGIILAVKDMLISALQRPYKDAKEIMKAQMFNFVSEHCWMVSPWEPNADILY